MKHNDNIQDDRRDEMQSADALDAFITACLAEQAAPLPPGVPAEEGALAAALVRLAKDAQPRAAFVAGLEAQLQMQGAAPRPRVLRVAPRLLPRLAWVAALLIMLVGLLAVPQVRAGVLEVLRVGAVRILITEPTATPPAVAPPGDGGQAPAGVPPATATTRLGNFLGLAGQTTLAEAQGAAGFAILLPTYPPDLGPPDQVFLQSLDGPVVVLVWLEPGEPDQVRLSLHQLSAATYAEKGDPVAIERTTVGGRPAVWSQGPYLLQFRGTDGTYLDFQHLVEGHVLIWQPEEGGVTYRLETELPLDEARRVAESLQEPLQPSP